jgi:hypothetical protein
MENYHDHKDVQVSQGSITAGFSCTAYVLQNQKELTK